MLHPKSGYQYLNKVTKHHDNNLILCRLHLHINFIYLCLSFSFGGWKLDLDMRNRALIGWRSNIGGFSSANSIAVMPTAQTSHCRNNKNKTSAVFIGTKQQLIANKSSEIRLFLKHKYTLLIYNYRPMFWSKM